jgi:acyl carrier protein
MLETVSEKTGYPVETLELEMDLEADLGIDSIKRVEILGAMQARYPGMPAVKPEELAELRTLAQVVGYIQRGLGAAEAAPQASPPPPSTPALSVELAAPRLRPLPPPDALQYELPAGWTCLLTDDGTAATAELASQLSARGWQTVVLRYPASLVPSPATLPPTVGRVPLESMDEEQLARAIRMVESGYGPIGAFIHLHPRTPAGATPFGGADEAIVRHLFLGLRHLKGSLERSAALGRGSFLAVARLDGALGTGGGAELGSVAGGLFGLAKTVRQEWPRVFCRAIDLAPEIDPATAAHAVLAELFDPDERLLEVGLGAHGRVTLVAEPVAAPLPRG